MFLTQEPVCLYAKLERIQRNFDAKAKSARNLFFFSTGPFNYFCKFLIKRQRSTSHNVAPFMWLQSGAGQVNEVLPDNHGEIKACWD